MICRQKIAKSRTRRAQRPSVRQIDDAEMVGIRPVKAGTLYDQHVLFMQEIIGKFHIIRDMEFLHIQLRENIERRPWLNEADARNLRELFADALALFIDTTARNQLLVDTLIAAESCLYHGLGRYIGAQTHVGKHIDALQIISTECHIARDHHPADPVAGNHMGLGKA